jgi:serine-type D-Ala-D-Ala carboxypeptidase (penicillin-binding protein 5/6)
MRKKNIQNKVIFIIFSIIFIIFCVSTKTSTQNIVLNAQSENIEEISTSAKSMCTIEGNSCRLLYSKNKDLKLPMASTTKIITAITALELNKDIDTKILIPDEAIGIEGTSMYIKKGEMFTIRELLYGLMLPSGNDCAVALSLITSSSQKKFVEEMQKIVEKVGAKNTHFSNPHGLDEDGHYTTSYDLSLITAYALKNKTFKEIVSTKNYKIPETENNDARYLKNKNKLLFTMPNCIGVKIGFTDNARRCLVSAAEQNGLMIITTVLNCGPMFEDCEKILNTALKDYKMTQILPPFNNFGSIPVTNGKQNLVKVYSQDEFSYPLKNDEIGKIKIVYNLPDFINAPIDKDNKIGEVQVFLNNRLLFSEKICTIESVDSIDANDKLHDIIDKWL